MEATLEEVISVDLKYEVWAPMVKATLTKKGLWDVVPELAATIQAQELSKWRDLVRKDTKALQILQCSLPDSVFRTTLSASSSKDLWNMLKKGNEQARLVKQFKLIITREKRERNIDEILKELSIVSSSQSTRAMESTRRRGDQCFHRGGYVRDYQTRIKLPKYRMLALNIVGLTFDENMWMICTTTTNHMTPYDKFFTTLDTRHRARVGLADGSSTMALRRGDVSIVTKEGKKTIKKPNA